VASTGAAPRPGRARAAAAPTDRQLRGSDAEDRAVRHLRAAGLELLQRNYRCRMGELDIVAREGSVLVVAEVRLRSSARYGGAAASITTAKQRRIVRATRHLLSRHPALQKLPLRFDALLVPPNQGPIEWIRGAFYAF
jgi:putative endonuclease